MEDKENKLLSKLESIKFISFGILIFHTIVLATSIYDSFSKSEEKLVFSHQSIEVY